MINGGLSLGFNVISFGVTICTFYLIHECIWEGNILIVNIQQIRQYLF